MGGKTPSTPPAPDPYATAGAQTGSNVSTAIANSWLGNANETGPYGSVTYKKTGTQKYTDPTTGTTYDIPTFNRDTKLSDAQQGLLDQQNQLGSKLNDLALNQTDKLNAHLSTPLSLDGLQDVGNFDAYQGKVEDAINTRLDKKFESDYNSLENRLANQGLQRGTEAFSKAMEEHGQNVNDARIQSFLASGNEARAAGGYDMSLRNNQLAERLTMRNQPINEVTALMNGGQVTVPQFQGYQGGNVGNTPVGDYIYKAWDQNNTRANQQAAANGQMWQNAGNVAAGMFKWSDRRLKTDILFTHRDDDGVAWYAFRYIGSGKVEHGVMAQELADIRPDLVHADPVTGYLFVDYGGLNART